MNKFEIGKRYYESGTTYEIIKRTTKTVTYRALQHAGMFNERVMKEATAKIRNWTNGEAFIDGYATVEA